MVPMGIDESEPGESNTPAVQASRTGNLLLMCLSTMITLVGLELTLRFSGYIPGYIPRYANRNFKPTDTLVLYNHFLTDEEGVFKANPQGDWNPESAINAHGFRSLPFDWNPEFIRINAHGFRSLPFEECQPEKLKILLLGDSFAWGASAKPLTNSFADRLVQEGYCVFNTGIPATDPRQYSFLAEKFVPLLKPAIVAVAFYMGNDFRVFYPMLPHKNLFHLTNIGFLQAFDEQDNYMTAEEAYKFRLKKSNLAAGYTETTEKTASVRIGKLLAKSVVGTYLLAALSEISNVVSAAKQLLQKPPVVNFSLLEKRKKIFKETREYLMNIEKVATQAGAQFMLFVIPVRPQDKTARNSIEANFMLFDGMTPLIPDNLTAADYVPNGHFNNTGHQKFASFMSAAFQSAQVCHGDTSGTGQ